MTLLPVGVGVHGGMFWGLDETRLRAQIRMMAEPTSQREQQGRWVQLQEALRNDTQRWQGDTLFSLMMGSCDILPIAMAAWVLCGTAINITQSPNHDPLHAIGPFQHRLWSMELQTNEQAARAEAPLPWSLPGPFLLQRVYRQPDGKDSAVLLLYAVTAPDQASRISLWIRDGVRNDM